MSVRSDSSPLRPSSLQTSAESGGGDYLALEKGVLVVITPATPQTKRGLVGALITPRSDSKDMSSQSASPSKSRSLSPSSSDSSQSRSSVSEPQTSQVSGDDEGNRKLLTKLNAYASRLKLPEDAPFHKEIGLLERQCAVLPPQEFGRSALKIYAAAKAQANEAAGGVDQIVESAVREASIHVTGARTDFTGFADTIQSNTILGAPGSHLEVHQGRVVVIHSMEDLSASEVRLAKAIDAKIRRGAASLTKDEEMLQITRGDNGKRFMRKTYAEGTAREDGKYGEPNVLGPIALEKVTANLAANAMVLEAVANQLKELGVGPSLVAQLKESMKSVLESPPELFAYRLAFRTKSWDQRVTMVRSGGARERFDEIAKRLKYFLNNAYLVKAEAHMLARYVERAFALAVDQEMALQPEMSRRDTKQKSLPAGQKLKELDTMSVGELTDMAIMEVRRTDLKSLSDQLPYLRPPLPPPLHPELAAKYARKDTT